VDRAGRLAFLSFDDELATPFVTHMDEDQLHSSWHLIEPDGTRLRKGPAAMALLDHLRPTRRVARALRALRLQWLVTAANSFFYVIRKKAGRFVPDVPTTRRWP
jgi:predicted DCC family thiol-disulfide oxidoreductase YuxK